MATRPGRLLAVVWSVLVLAACGHNRPAPEPAAQATGEPGGPRVGVILPETATSERWSRFDQPLLRDALLRAGLTPIVQNAQGDAQKFAQIADSMLGQRVRVLILAAPSGDVGATVELRARQQGVPVIGYDRLSAGGSADYHVSFDHVAVGELQARALAAATRDRPGAQVIEIGGSPTDHNAALVHDGQRRVLDPLYRTGRLRQAGGHFVDGWDSRTGGQVFEQLLTANGGRVDAVLAANDGLAGAVITVLQKYGLAGRVPVTGQDTTVDGLRAVLRGDQSSTVFKPIRQEADVAAGLAAALVRGDTAAADRMASRVVRDPGTGREIRSVLLAPQLVTRDTVGEVVGSGHVSAAEVCPDELAATCRRLGIAG